MHAIRIIGSTDLGWHRADAISTDMLMCFAEFDDVMVFDVTAGGAKEAPSTCYGFAKNQNCPFTLADAHCVLEMLRPLLLETTNDKPESHNRIQ